MTILTKAVLTDLLTVFDEVLPATNESLMVYWLLAKRPDGYLVTLIVDGLEDSVAVIVETRPGLATTHISLHQCRSVRVLDVRRRVLEIVADYGSGTGIRCVLAIDSDTIVQCKDVLEATQQEAPSGASAR